MKVTIATAVLLLFCVARADELRVWTFQSKATVKGRFVEFTGTNGVTILRAEDKKTYVLPIAKLSTEDQPFLAALRKKQEKDRAFTVTWQGYVESDKVWCNVVNNSNKTGSIELTFEFYDRDGTSRIELHREYFSDLAPHKSESRRFEVPDLTLFKAGLPNTRDHVKVIKEVTLRE